MENDIKMLRVTFNEFCKKNHLEKFVKIEQKQKTKKMGHGHFFTPYISKNLKKMGHVNCLFALS